MEEEIGSNAKSYLVDVSNVNEINKFIQSVEQDFGCINILVNNAGICPRLSFANSTEKDWQILFDVNAKSQYFLCQAVWPVGRLPARLWICRRSCLSPEHHERRRTL